MGAKASSVAKGFGRETGFPMKEAAEVAAIRKADQQRDLGDRFLSIQ